MDTFPLWILPVFMIVNFIIRIRVHTRMGIQTICTLGTNTAIWTILFIYLSFHDFPRIYHDWALGLAFCSSLFWNSLLMYLTRNRHIK